MAKERLSKLQKWILMKCYENLAERKMFVQKDDGKGSWEKGEVHGIQRQQIFNYFKNSNNSELYSYSNTQFTSKEYNKMNVTITRSVRTLLKHRYIDAEAFWEQSLCIYDPILAKALNRKVSLTNSEYLQGKFKEYQEGHNINEELIGGKFAIPFIPNTEGEIKEYRESHPNITFKEWYTEKKVEVYRWGHKTFKTQKELSKYYPEKDTGNIKFIYLTEKGIKKAEEFLNVNFKTSTPPTYSKLNNKEGGIK